MSFGNEHSHPQGVQTSSVVPTPRRLLTVVVADWVIEDGSIVPPTVGDTVSVALQFRRYAPDPADPRICTVRAFAQPLEADAPPIVDRDGRWWWTMMLRGDGWSAVWWTQRPLIDHVEVTGVFFANTELGSGTARGLVRRVQLMTGETTYDPHTRSWAAVADEDIRYTDIDASPRWFGRPDPPDPAPAGHGVERQLGVLIELDLDAAEPAPLRPRVRPGTLSSAGGVLWMLDRQLPVLLQIDDPAGAAVATEHLLPLSIAATAGSPPRGQVVADEAGCWIVAEQTVLRCTLDVAGALEVHRIDLGYRMAAAAACGSVLLTAGAGVFVLRPGTEPLRVELPTARWVAATSEGFIAVVPTVTEGGAAAFPRTYRMVRIDVDGTVTDGPQIPLASPVRVGSTGDRMAIYDRRGVAVSIGADLTSTPVPALPGRPLTFGGAGGYLWMTTRRPDGTGKTGWWPFDSPHELPAREHGRFLLVLLDPATYRVVAAAAIDDPEPAVTIDEQDRVWVATARDVYLLDPAGTLVELDVAARLRTE
ncbi:hypothetical protein MX572_26145 (plasmid) [Rhodococcus pyridinivorans]|uniref:hypothetical protein n=1 Tax=Rhodococcus pyridinivorans TaxID=103816 RepID=UPI0020C6DCF0|nr:hypothetical protein [Rhodococcus pyridinivorans]UTM40131.1 hypothetical protein MX572_26145 [Rhodococcus pyridinivorans]